MAKPLPEFGDNAPYETSVKDLVGSLVPDDYFRFTVSRAGYVTVYLENLLADADLYLYDAKNRLIGESARSGVTDEKIIANLPAGTYLARVHSANGVTTDYDLKVRFDGLPTSTQTGNSNTTTGGGGSKPTFNDPRLEQIFIKARDNFANAEWTKTNSQINQLETQKAQKQRELDTLLVQAVVEQKAKIYTQLDGVRSDIQSKISAGAGNITSVIDRFANDAIVAVNSLIPDWLKDKLDWLSVGGLAKDAQTMLRNTIGSARNWLDGQVNSVRNQINSAVGRFNEMVKSAYMSGSEVNQSIENATNWLNGETARLSNSLNDKIGEFKGQILGKLEWAKNVRTPDWARNLGVPDWNLYDHAIVGLANGVTSGVNYAINGAVSFFMSTVTTVKSLVQGAVAVVVDAIFGDKTGNSYNEISGINRQIDGIHNTVQKVIDNQTIKFKADIEGLLGSLGLDGKKIFATLMDFSQSPTAQIGMVVLEVLLRLVPGVGQAIDIKDTAISLHEILIQGKRGIGEFVGLIGALAGWVPGLGDAIKSVAKVAMKGANFLTPIVKRLGSGITESAIGKVDSLDWGGILKNSVNDLSLMWESFSKVLDKSAGWILDSLNLRPNFAVASGMIASLKRESGEVASQLMPAKNNLVKIVKESAEKAVETFITSSFRKVNLTKFDRETLAAYTDIAKKNPPYIPAIAEGNAFADFVKSKLPIQYKAEFKHNPDNLLRSADAFAFVEKGGKEGASLIEVMRSGIPFDTSGSRKFLQAESYGSSIGRFLVLGQPVEMKYISLKEPTLSQKENLVAAIEKGIRETVDNQFDKLITDGVDPVSLTRNVKFNIELEVWE